MATKNQEVEKKRTVNVESSLTEQIVIPTDQELAFSKKCKQPIINKKYAVKILKFDKRHIINMNVDNIDEQREGYRTVCNLYLVKNFLLHIQVKEGTEFTDEQIKFINGIQGITETSFFCVYEKSYKQDARDFRKQVSEAINQHPDKEIIAVIEVFTANRDLKIGILKELQIKKCAVIYRNYKKYTLEWSELMALLDSAEIYSFVLGIQPRMRRKNRASLLIAPYRYKANAVAHGLPWSGGNPFVSLLDNWVYKKPSLVKSGSTNYNKNNRLTIESEINDKKEKYAFTRVDALNEANALLSSLTIEQIKSLLD